MECGWERMWPAFRQAYDEMVAPAPPAAEPELRHELLFCLLGGHGVSYEMSASAVSAVGTLDVFAPDHDGDKLADRLLAVLSEPRYDPPRSDGSPRRYRFPARKSDLILGARDWLLDAGTLTEHLACRSSEHERRRWLLGCPGVGPKTASWILRNTGWAYELAILDVHVLRAMSENGIATAPPTDARAYERLELQFLAWCETLGAAPAVFDLFLWEWQRGSLAARPQSL